MSSKFVHLHVHSHYSLLEALPKVKDMLNHVKDLEMDSVAITDNGAMYGTIEFYQKAQDAGVKPIIGFDAYVAAESRHQKRHRIDNKPYRLVLLAETNEGYKNLLTLSSIGFLEGFYYRPRIDKEVLKQYSKGIIALSGGFMGEIDEKLKLGDEEGAKQSIRDYVEIFGEGNFFLELVDRPEIAEQETANAKLIELGKELGIPLVATKNTFYLKPTDVEAWKILNCIKGGKTLEDFNRVNQYDYDASMVSGEYMEERFSDVPEAIENTRKIADRCNVELTLGEWNFPKFDIPEGTTFKEVLKDRTYKEIMNKIEGDLTQEYKDRIEYELDIIEFKGFSPYFLIVSDFLTWAKEHGIVTTTRGSAAGSLVGYAIGISGIDPMLYKLPFERFLNPERPSAPDIDADFADNRRDEVLDYVREKYGKEKVAQICTFGTMAARGSVRDVGRGLGEPYDFVDLIAKLVPMGKQGMTMTLARALDEEPELKKRYDTEPRVRRIINLAQQIEGCGRHVSVHAAGTVISPSALDDFTPIQIDTREGKVITQYEMKSVESAGLIKFDFLGIRNLSILGDAVHLVKKTKGIDIDIEKIPVDDEKTFKLLAQGHTMGVFQLSGDGMTKYLMELKPERVEDIMAMVALYRPGPIESIPEYIKRKYDPSKVSFLDPRMKEILDKSYGVIVYQDDVMLIAIKLAGYSWLEADKLRKAMGKKIPEVMAEQKIKLFDGLKEHGMPQKKINELWKLIEPFAMYGFNKAHAASYGIIAYYTAYMKANYPAEYMSALMTAESADLEKIAHAVKECDRMGIDVLPPDINESLKDFTYIDDKTIRFGLLVIKNLGEEAIEGLIAERKASGPYIDMADMATRLSSKSLNKKSLEALGKVGALERFGERKEILENLDRILQFNKTIQKQKEANQSSLFDLAPTVMDAKITLREVEPATKQERLAWEKELLGLYVSDHPYDDVRKKLGGKLLACDAVQAKKDKDFVQTGGVVTYVKQIITKKGDPMAFIGISDNQGDAEVIVFPRTFEQYKHLLDEDAILLVSAKVSRREGEEEAKLLANSFIHVTDENQDHICAQVASGMWVPHDKASMDQSPVMPGPPSADTPPPPIDAPKFKTRGQAASAPFGDGAMDGSQGFLSIALKGKPSPDMVQRLRDLFREHPGQERVCFLVESAGRTRRVETEYTIRRTKELIDQIASVVGRQNIHV